VLEEVREAELAVVFEHGADIDHKPQLRAIARFGVFADVISQAVLELAGTQLGIGRYRLVERNIEGFTWQRPA
jgi:hypothetical protein